MHLQTTTFDVPAGEEDTARAKMDALGFHTLVHPQTLGKISVMYTKDRAREVLAALNPEKAAALQEKEDQQPRRKANRPTPTSDE